MTETRNTNNWISRLLDRKSPAFVIRLFILATGGFALTGIYLSFKANSYALLANSILYVIDTFSILVFLSALRNTLKHTDIGFNEEEFRQESLAVLIFSIPVLIFSIAFCAYIVMNWEIGLIVWHIPVIIFLFIQYLIFRQLNSLKMRKARQYDITLLTFNLAGWRYGNNTEIILSSGFALSFLLVNTELLIESAILDIVLALVIIIMALRVPFLQLGESINILMQRNIPEELYFEVLTIVADNIDQISEYKSTDIKRLRNGFLVTIEITMPPDLTIENKSELEKIFENELRKNFKRISVRLYADPSTIRTFNRESHGESNIIDS